MFNNASSHLAYANTLVNIFSHRLLSNDEFNILIKNNDCEQTRKIFNKAGLNHLTTVFDQHDKQVCNIEQIENLLLTEYIKQSVKLIRGFSGDEHQLLLYWLRQVEISNIKTILRGKAMHRPTLMIQDHLLELGEFSTLPEDSLLHAEDVSEVLRLLDDTIYSSMAHHTSAQYEQYKDIFSLETSVDQQYFIGLVRRLDSLALDTKEKLSPLFGRMIDQINLTRLLRYRINYQLSPSHIYFLLSANGFRFKHQQLQLLLKFNSLEDIVQEFPDFLINRFAEQSKEQFSIQTINAVMEQELIEYAFKVLRDNRFSFASVFAFLFIRKNQLSLIHAILKGKSMNMNEQTIRFAIGFR